MTTKEHYRVCNLCEAMCGLTITYQGDQVLSIKGDEKDPFSKGHICPKGAKIDELHYNPDRLKEPLRKKEDGSWETISWEAAFEEVGNRINAIRQEYGADAVGFYLGNPTAHNFGFMSHGSELRKILGTKNYYTPTTMDQLPHHFMAYHLYGHTLRMPIPDVDRTDFMLIIGGNPVASNGSLMSVAGIQQKLRAISKRGGKVITIDPRRTETSKVADEHYFIVPGTDIYFLMGILKVLVDNGWMNPGRMNEFMINYEELISLASEIEGETIAHITQIPWENIVDIATTYAQTEKAILYGRMGMSTQEHGGLCNWLLQCINMLSGKFDREGCTMFPKPAFPLFGGKKFRKSIGRWHSRVSKVPEFSGELPVSVMAEEMLVEGEGRMRAMIIHAGNPVLSVPNSREVERGLQNLDFLVSVDIFLNETNRHADIILPPASHLEVDHYDAIFNYLAVSDVAKFSPALYKPKKGQKYDWQIAKAFLKHFEKTSKKKTDWKFRYLTPRQLLNLGLLFGPYGKLSSWKRLFTGLSLGKLKRNPHGISLGPLKQQLPHILSTPSGKIDIGQEIFMQPFRELLKDMKNYQPQPREKNEFLFIGRRHLRSNNSWMHNSPTLMKGKNRCTAMLHPDDALALDIQDGQIISVQSTTGRIDIATELSKNIMPGVICIPHGFGHDGKGTRLKVANKKENAGVNVNELMDNKMIDPVTGNIAFSGQTLEVIT
ncbi:MAG: molybdopterin-dependent oxidoreductase [Bacteroidota bacterium]